MSILNKLNKLNPGESAVVNSFSDQQLGCKLMSMGILPGTFIRVIRKAPFGDTIYIKADHQQFAIRNNEAACILLN